MGIGIAICDRMALTHHTLVAWQRADDLFISLHVARRLEYISNETFGELELDVRKVGAPLRGLIDRLGQVHRA